MSAGNPSPPARPSERNDPRSRAIREFLEAHAPCDDQDLLAEMMVTLCRLAKDGCGRGELKILNTAFKELRYAFKVFAPYDDVPKVSMFGSARTPEDHPHYRQAVLFAQLMEQAGWMIITGAGDGIMRAGHYGAQREASFGVAIRLPFEQSANTIIADDDKLINFKYFFTRKLLFVKEARALALFPGGFGTQDEGFEALTLIQTGKAAPTPIVLVDEPGGTYWQHWRTYVQAELLRTGMISPEDMHLFHLTDVAEDAVREITHFYRRYHSSRYVRRNLVMRLQSPLAGEAVAALNEQFGDLVGGGTIRQTAGPLEEEGNELPDLARLVFEYNNSSAGRLRLMIDAINDAD